MESERDGSGATTRERRANACWVEYTRGELHLYFGTTDVAGPPGRRRSVRLSDRVIVTPPTARGIVETLETFFERYEAQFGPLEPGVAAGSPATPPAASDARLMTGAIDDLGVEYGHERSFRLGRDRLLADRFMLSVSRSALGERYRPAVLGVCDRVGMPSGLRRALEVELPAGRFVHFGFEGGTDAPMLKVYVEYPVDEGPRPVGGQEPVLLHQAYKWSPGGRPEGTVSRYLWYPTPSVDGVMERISRIHERARDDGALPIVREILALVAARTAAEDLRYLEVAERDNPRCSWDVTAYDADLRLDRIHPLLQRMCDHLGVARESFETLYRSIASDRFGHLAGGVHRDGGTFFTVYHGAVMRRGASEPGQV